MPATLCKSTNEKAHLNEKIPNGGGSTTPPSIRRAHIGVWDCYEAVDDEGPAIPFASLYSKYNDAVECVPYIVRMINDVLSIPGCALLVFAYAATDLVQAFLPAISIWFQGQLLQITQVAIDTRTVDKARLFKICAGRIACSVVGIILYRVRRRVGNPLNARIRRWYALHSFHSRARLDLPTYAQPAVQRQVGDASDNMWGQTVVWQTLELATDIVSAATQLAASSAVLFQVLKDHQDGSVLALLTLFGETYYWLSQFNTFRTTRVWLATTFNQDYMKMQGWKKAVRDLLHRKEFVAGGLAGYATAEFQKAAERVGDMDADWNEVEDQILNRSSAWTMLKEPLTHLPQIYFTLRAAQAPASIPLSLASLNLIQSATDRFAFTVYEIIRRTQSVGHQLESVKKLYEVVNIPNLVKDGTKPFPEDQNQIRSGIELEFRNVSFKYPDTEKWALRSISFKLLPGQLCVIVGANGAGKSTILKLTTRLYDPDEGEIFFGGHDIRTLKLDDLRRAITVLFQDYTLFPLSIRDNIALGDPASTNASTSDVDERVERAAQLAGADGFIAKLPDGMNTYLDRPVDDEYSPAVEGTKRFSGRTVDYEPLRTAAGIKRAGAVAGLSGGQMQRLAVARTIMRSVVKEDEGVGMLLFDEPSASLDPAGEHDLFDRLRELRGSKTMVFSSHRFGNLTRHADLILYMDETGIVESGTHDELLGKKGEYARLWTLQAQAFI
ncbi:HlyB/MsbA family ABC transporter [Dichomitus squalens LYAD-421 SS1]|uniref:HlyB/MsbA family ABC transporter n=1 Tax=Dichomitus squalens (strain LYAD-421) TaxID=732165 RepID=R7SJ13_DICSQ|nr:HlyB/MsbA family ABC transporter [Dichomitus squalens LYAD-421 SS1]EJF56134.1 HlyB/MsbA family ABC transporter [Dichomitus squalens LYAD-421 SS1]